MRLPNLILAGAPKCGTSSLFNWLIAHPQVCGSSPKETRYFLDTNRADINPEANYNFHRLDRYSSFFQHCSPEAKVMLEGTPRYIYQKTALDFFSSCQPQPHVVFILRKPSRRIFSSFTYLQNNLGRIDSSISFAEVTDLLLKDRSELIKDWGYSEDSDMWRWLQVQLSQNRYHDWLKLWFERFPPEKLTVLLFEETIANPRITLIHLAEKLGIDAEFYDRFHFEKRNKTMAIKNKLVHQSLTKLAPLFTSSPIRSTLKSLYFQFNGSTPTSADSNSLEQLDEYFAPYNFPLANDYNLNLDYWQ